jgi:hypothetical protein
MSGLFNIQFINSDLKLTFSFGGFAGFGGSGSGGFAAAPAQKGG